MDINDLALPFLGVIFDRLDAVAWHNPMINNPLLQMLEDDIKNASLQNLDSIEEAVSNVFENAVEDAEDQRPKEIDRSRLPELAGEVGSSIHEQSGDLVFLRQKLGFNIDELRDIAEEFVKVRGDKIYSLMSTYREAAYGGKTRKARTVESIAPILLGYERDIISRLGIDRHILLDSGEISPKQINEMFPIRGEGNSSARDPRRR